MSGEELQAKLETIIKAFPASGYDAIPDSVIADLAASAAQAEGAGMKNGKETIDDLVTVLKARKAGSKTDDSVMVRITALEFYIQKLKDGTAEG